MTRDEIQAELRQRAEVAAALPEMPSNLTDDEQLAWLQNLLRHRRREMNLSPQKPPPQLCSPTNMPRNTSSPA